MDKAVSSIQLFILKSRFLESLFKCKYIFAILNSFKIIKLNKDLNSINEINQLFIKMKSYINEPDITNSISGMLNKYYRWICRNDRNYYRMIAPKLDSEKFLGSYILAIFPEFLLSSTHNEIIENKNDTVYHIYTMANDLINNINYINQFDNNTKLDEFVKSINNYSNAFRDLITKGKVKTINELIVKWNDLENMKSKFSIDSKSITQQKKSLIECLDKRQELIMSSIKKIDRKFDTNLLYQSKSITHFFEQTMGKNYWTLLDEDMKKGKTEILVQSLKYIRYCLSFLHKKSKKELGELFDNDIIIQKLDSPKFNFNDLLIVVDYLVEKMIYLQSSNQKYTRARWFDIQVKSVDNIELLISSSVDNIELLISSKDQQLYSKYYTDSAIVIIKFILEEIDITKKNIISTIVLSNLYYY